jgi:hypothetical protein
MACRRCGGTVLPPATICGKCDAPAPAPAPETKAASQPTGFVSTAIPSKNGPALISYYCGLFSVIPYVGYVLAPTAVVTGIVGLRRATSNPEIRGKAHAWTGILAALVLGTVGHLYRDRLDSLLSLVSVGR